MKNVFALFFTIFSTWAAAQDVVVSAGAEKTVKGHQYCGGVLVETRKFWGAGAFYQAGINRKVGEGTLSDPFYGITMQAPLVNSNRVLVAAIMRTGLVNDRFFAVVPSLETRILITPKAGALVGAGLRYGYPSISARVFIKLF